MNKYWFFDSAVKRSTEGAKVIPGKIIKDKRNPLFTEGIRETPSLPWEVLIGNGYPNVFYDPHVQKYRCYYTCYLSADYINSNDLNKQEYKAKESRITGILYAESEDGIHWLKPALGAVEYAAISCCWGIVPLRLFFIRESVRLYTALVCSPSNCNTCPCLTY